MSSLAEIPVPRGKYNEVKDAFLEYAFPEQAGNDMSLYISLLNNMAVSIFWGNIISVIFVMRCPLWKRKLIFIGCMVLLPLIQSILYFSKGADFVRHIYPLAVHLPLVIVLWC